MSRINQILGIVIDSIYDSLILYFLFIVCMMNFFIGRVMDEMLPLTVSFILALRFVLPFFKEGKNFRFIFIGSVLLTASVLSFFVFQNDDFIFWLLGCGYFSACGFTVWIKDKKEGYLPEEMKKLLILLFVSGFMTMYLRSKEYLEIINETAAFYCLFSLVYFVRMNLIHEYKSSSVEVNSHFNLVVINLLSLFIAVVFIVLQRNVLTWFPYLFLLIIMGAIELFRHIWTVINWILETVLAISLKIQPSGYTKTGSENPDSSVEELIFQEEALPRDLQDIQGAVEHYEGVRILIMMLILVLFAFLIYFFYKKMNSVFNENLGDPEEKEFILSKKEITNSFKKRINRLLNWDLTDPTRKKYVKTVNHLIKKGYEMEKDMTPNEYLISVERKNEDLSHECDLNSLTKDYNEVRYLKGK